MYIIFYVLRSDIWETVRTYITSCISHILIFEKRMSVCDLKMSVGGISINYKFFFFIFSFQKNIFFFFLFLNKFGYSLSVYYTLILIFTLSCLIVHNHQNILIHIYDVLIIAPHASLHVHCVAFLLNYN